MKSKILFVSTLLLVQVSVFAKTVRPFTVSRLTSDSPYSNPQVETTKSMKNSFGSTFSHDYEKRVEVGLKVLILSATDNIEIEPSLDEAKQTLRSYGIPFEHVVLTKDGTRLSDKPVSLRNSDGSGKYYGIIVTTGDLTYLKADGINESALTTTQWDELKKYERDFQVRRVSLNTYPIPALGVQPLSNVDNGAPNSLFLNRVGEKLDPAMVDQINVPLEDSWQYPSTMLASSTVSEPFLFFTKQYFASRAAAVAGVISTFPDTREQMHFFFSQSSYSRGSTIIAPMWINWLTRGVYVGKRRIYFNIQVDDVFLSTQLWNPAKAKNKDVPAKLHRTTIYDIESFLKFQKNVMQPTARNSDYQVELAYNGVGVNAFGGPSKDLLFQYMVQNSSDFNWVSHTYNHFALDTLSYSKVMSEIKDNLSLTSTLLRGKMQYFSPKSMVTPGITGFFNGEALKAFMDSGITNLIGDNSRKELSPDNLYSAKLTTKEANGYEGVLIVPRYPTEIYFNVSSPDELLSEYNSINGVAGGEGAVNSIDTILERESKKVSNFLLRFQYDPYMFHQANMRAFPYRGNIESLLSLWMKSVVYKVRNYTDLPILNVKFDDLADLYLQRMKFEKCGFEGRLVYINDKLKEVKGNSKDNCQVAITGVKSHDPRIFNAEKYGPDNTVYFNMNKYSPVTMPIKPSEDY